MVVGMGLDKAAGQGEKKSVYANGGEGEGKGKRKSQREENVSEDTKR